jgi:OOP family OmpA-OmpF porin
VARTASPNEKNNFSDFSEKETMMVPRLSLCLALLAFGISPASAQSKFYLGGAVGRLHLDSDFAQQVNSSRSGDVVAPADIHVDSKRRTGGRVFGGFRFTPVFALEVDYVDLGEIATGYRTFDDRLTVLPDNLTGRAFATFEHTSRVNGYGVSAVATLPVADNLGILARVGAARLHSNIKGQITSFLPVVRNTTAPGVVQFNPLSVGPTNVDVTQTRPVLGLGIDYRMTDRLRLRATWDRYFGVGKSVSFGADTRGKHDIDLMSVGITFDF